MVMKNYLLTILFVLPWLSQAQVKTGGGAVIEPEKNEYGEGGGRSGLTIMGEYIKHLKARELVCGEKKRMHFKSEDFMKVYMSLSVYATLFSATGDQNKEQCDFATAYLNCLNDDKAKQLYKKFSETKEIRDYLKIKYEISDAEVEKMIKFFEKFEPAPK